MAFRRVTIIPVVSAGQAVTPAVRNGRPTDYLPPLRADDLVYAAGAPAMVEEVTQIARAARAVCLTDPFEPAQTPDTLLSRAAQWLKPVIPAPPAAPSLSMTGWIDEYSARKQPARV